MHKFPCHITSYYLLQITNLLDSLHLDNFCHFIDLRNTFDLKFQMGRKQLILSRIPAERIYLIFLSLYKNLFEKYRSKKKSSNIIKSRQVYVELRVCRVQKSYKQINKLNQNKSSKKQVIYFTICNERNQSQVQLKMKTMAVIFLAFFLVQNAMSLSCSTGYYDSGAPKCTQCAKFFSACTTANVGTPLKQLVGYSLVNDIASQFCPWGTSAYVKEKDMCSVECKVGCLNCQIDYDFCTDCQSGYIWNPDYSCIPAVIGLEAASLALLAIGFVFLVVGFCYVNKARK